MNSLDWVLRQQEGQFFERKSCFAFLKAKLRPVRAVARDVVETLARKAQSVGGGLSSQLSRTAPGIALNELSSTLIEISNILIDFGLNMKVLDICLKLTETASKIKGNS